MITRTYRRNAGPVTTWQTDPAAVPATDPKVLIAAQGVKAWTALHTAAVAGTLTLAWLQGAWRQMVPAYGCACLRAWDDLLAVHPFRPADLFVWSVEIHNAVNLKLGKPQLTLAQATAIWPAPPTESVQPV